MEGLITPERDDEDTAKLNYVRVQRGGEQENVWYHEDRDSPLVGDDLASVDDADEWRLRWYCPRCGSYEDEIPDSDLQPAGSTELHRPCATEAEIQSAAAGGDGVLLDVPDE